MGAHYERAQVLIRQKRYAEAERELREELAENPHGGQAHAFLGHCLAQQKRMTEAVEAGEEGVRLAPQLAHVHYLLGLTYVDCRRHEEAEAALREALRLNPRNASYLEWLSWVQFLRGDRRGALVTAEQGLAIDPEHVGCLNYRGQCKRILGNWKDAEETLRESLRHNPENDFTHANLAMALFQKAIARARGERKATSWPWRPEMAEARQHCQEALRLNPCSDFAKNVMTEILSAPMAQIIGIAGLMSGFMACMLCLLAVGITPSRPGGSISPGDEGLFKAVLLVLCGVLTVGISKGPRYLLLRRSRIGTAVLTPGRRRAANATMLCLGLAAVAAVAAIATTPPAAFAGLYLSLALVQPLTVACEATPGWPRRLMVLYVGVLAAIGGTCLILICRGERGPFSPAVATLVVWVTAASILSRLVGRRLEKWFLRKLG